MVIKFCFILLILNFSSTFAQDIIYLNGKKTINAKIVETDNESIKYLHNPNRPTFTVPRSEIKEINFENGAVEVFRNVPPPSSLSIEQLKSKILEKINSYTFDAKSTTRPYRASFEGDYLKLWIMRSRGDEPYSKPILFDFSRAYDFQDISYRSNEAFINIFVGFLDKKGKVDKVKLVIRVLEKEQAEKIVTLLKTYNRLLAEKSIRIEKS
ncbi:hypothetical protein [Aequorivita sp. CIP111184]|uniref:hypothetical protein n=1 Tax=Aequorivita sp. CIP111184 TaxID=2211356 RepID=UPI000DBBFF18|nr:hypothetical protein [Aequorivita sp. CIP111184]SRX52960.1 hypothetical protein AEQU1_00787 [Aequorivita sp. CIP111184]